MSVTVNDTDNILIFGGDDDAIATAPLGTAMPTGLTELTAPWGGLGWLSEDGIEFDEKVDSTDFKGHQGGATVASIINSEDKTFKFQCLETTARTMGLRWSGLTIAEQGTGTGVYGGEVKGALSKSFGLVVDQFAINAFLPDGSPIHERYAVPKATVSDKGTMVAKRDEMRVLEFTAKVIGNFFFWTNNPAMAPVA